MRERENKAERGTETGRGEARRRKVRTKEARRFMPVAGAEEGRAFLEEEKKGKKSKASADVCHAQAPVTFSACHPQWVTPRPQDHHRRLASRHKWRSPGHFQVDRGLSRGENTTLTNLHPRRNYRNMARRKKNKKKKNNGSGAFFNKIRRIARH